MDPRPAATVLLLRDRDDGGIEVLMLRKNPRTEFASGAYVFPGGAVEEHDAALGDRADLHEGPTDLEASEILGVESGGLAYYSAAIREAFEEAGILLALDRASGSNPVDLSADPELAARMADARDILNAGEADLVSIIEAEERLLLGTRDLIYMSHWITPVGPPRRYDTRFFMARTPAGQVALHEGGETVATLWISPQDALAAAGRNEIEIMFPTLRHLEQIVAFTTVDEALAWGRDREVPKIQPRIVADEGGIRVVLPGDEGYEDAGP